MRLPASSVTRVLPTPPVPVSVTSGLRASIARTRSSSASRPISAVNCRGRLVGRASVDLYRRKVLRQPGDLDLIDVDRLRRIVERRRTNVAQRGERSRVRR